MNDQHRQPPKLPNPAEAVITQDAWAQIASHLPMTVERRAEEDRIAAERQRGVEDLLGQSEYPTNRLRHVRPLVPPAPGMAMRDVYARYDGAMVVCWCGDDGIDVLTIETETDSLRGIDESCFPGPVSYIVPVPGGYWLGTAARVDAEARTGSTLVEIVSTMVVPDTAWIISPDGEVVASGCLGDAAQRPVVGRGGQIWVTYFDEAPSRGSGGAWRRDEGGEFEFIEGSVVAPDDVTEHSGYGRYTAGYTGMTVFDADLRVIDRHPVNGTPIVDVYATHSDGDEFWYVSYPEWVIDGHGSTGQRAPIADPSHKGSPLIASGERLARFSGGGRHRDSLFVRLPDGGEEISIVTFPDGSPLRRGVITTWGPYLHYFDGLDWYALDVFAA